MASYQIRWKKTALRELRKLPSQAARRIVAAVEALASDPSPQGAKKLIGTGRIFRLRVGQYRVLYEVFSAQLVIEIIRVGLRKTVYRRL